MKVFFDNCTSPVLASTLNGYIRNCGHEAVHIKDIQGLPKGRSSADLEWIELLRNSKDFWIFISADKRVLRNPAERAALRSAGLHGFILGQAALEIPLNQAAAMLLWKWPEIEKITEIVAAPAMHEIPMNKATKLKSLSL